ncbi:MAG: DNA-3-methyladenine glycosylase I [Candidatus Neomarinimicrobiota bacterium]
MTVTEQSGANAITRCWGDGDPLMEAYHDSEWGRPVHDDRTLCEFLLLDNFQAGLSWRTILHKRENFRRAFDGFDPYKIAAYTNVDRQRLIADPGIIRNRAKVNAAITNAQAFLKVQKEFGSFDQYIWQFTDYQTIRNPGYTAWEDIPVSSPESDAMSRDLGIRGFKFVGTTICYAYMQGIGMVDDHLLTCFLYGQL